MLIFFGKGSTIFSAKIVGIYKGSIQKWQVLSSFGLGYEGITPVLSASFGDVIPTLHVHSRDEKKQEAVRSVNEMLAVQG